MQFCRAHRDESIGTPEFQKYCIFDNSKVVFVLVNNAVHFCSKITAMFFYSVRNQLNNNGSCPVELITKYTNRLVSMRPTKLHLQFFRLSRLNFFFEIIIILWNQQSWFIFLVYYPVLLFRCLSEVYFFLSKSYFC